MIVIKFSLLTLLSNSDNILMHANYNYWHSSPLCGTLVAGQCYCVQIWYTLEYGHIHPCWKVDKNPSSNPCTDHTAYMHHKLGLFWVTWRYRLRHHWTRVIWFPVGGELRPTLLCCMVAEILGGGWQTLICCIMLRFWSHWLQWLLNWTTCWYYSCCVCLMIWFHRVFSVKCWHVNLAGM